MNLKVNKAPYKIRFDYHKCLTRFMSSAFDKNYHFRGNRKRFVQHLEGVKAPRFISLNNQVLWPDRKIFSDALMTHTIRHPIDLIISGYFYYKKSPEKWTVDTMRRLWLYFFSFELDTILNTREKKLLSSEISYQQLLNELPFEKGMMVEMVWLEYIKTFNLLVYYNCEKILTLRFEDIVQDLQEEIQKMCSHWQLDEEQIAYYVDRAVFFTKRPIYPIRNKSAYQFRNYFNKDLDSFLVNTN